MLRESLGQRLKKEREAKNFDIKTISKETNIIPRYIQALENNEFEKFPSETYLLGFLRSYGNFLNINDEEMLHLYRAQQISESQTPLEELTRPSRKMPLKINWNLGKSFFFLKILVGIALIAGIMKLGSIGLKLIQKKGIETIKADTKQKTPIPNFAKFETIKLVRNRAESLLEKGSAAIFTIENKEYAYQLTEINAPEGTAKIKIFPDEKEWTINTKTESPITIAGCIYQLNFLIKGQTPRTARIEIRQGELLNKNDISHSVTTEKLSSEDLIIKVKLHLNDNSYVEAYADGKKIFGGMLTNGKNIFWTAKTTLQLYLGNADGVEIVVNDKPFQFKGKVMNKTFYWKRDPLYPAKWDIAVK